MRKWLIILIIFALAGAAGAEDLFSQKLLNANKLGSVFNDYLGYLYYSHGCLHFTPGDVYLLTHCLPNRTPITIKKYKEVDPPFDVKSVPFLSDITDTQQDVKDHALNLKRQPSELLVYPGLGKVFILLGGKPYAQLNTLAGPAETLRMPTEVSIGQPVRWDPELVTPTDPGHYSVLTATDHYRSATYRLNTIIPFGAWLIRKEGKWVYQDNDDWFAVPGEIAADLAGYPDNNVFNYYDVCYDGQGAIWAARYAGHDFGDWVLEWTKDGTTMYPELGYAAGELLYEQKILVKDLVFLLTAPGADDFETLADQNPNFRRYKQLAEFVNSAGQIDNTDLDPAAKAYYKLFRNFKMKPAEFNYVDHRVFDAHVQNVERRLPRTMAARQQALGFVEYLKFNAAVIEKQADWYRKVKRDWAFWQQLRAGLRDDFPKLGVRSLENQQNIVEEWLSSRLVYDLAYPPEGAKNAGELSFSAQFDDEYINPVFTKREQVLMLEQVERVLASTAETPELTLYSVDALNKYNFGLLLNDILGDLYKSHGCLHVTPRDAYFLYVLLPLKSRINVHTYDDVVSAEALAALPFLTTLVNTAADLEELRKKFSKAAEVDIEVYPASGYWIVHLKGQPFAKLSVKGGPQAKYYLMNGRDEEGKPVFSPNVAYPTTPGTFYVFKKFDNYVSNLYYPTTIMPQGTTIKKEKGKWVFINEGGKWQGVHQSIALDLGKPLGEQTYTYYDVTLNDSGEAVELKWGDQPFGRYAMQKSADMRTPNAELIHSSGTLIMEQRGLIDELISILSAPQDEFEDCLSYSENFELYRSCADFVADPANNQELEVKERASYKLYFNLPLTSEEAATLPRDSVLASRILKGEKLNKDEQRFLIGQGVADWRGGEFKYDMAKILGLQYDTYQYVVSIQKYAHHYETLKKYWPQLKELRQALLKDFNNLVIRDPKLLHRFVRELMIKRTELKQLTQREALTLLGDMLK